MSGRSAVRRRRIIAYLAVSADGFIARPDGDVEWLNDRPQTDDYGFKRFYATVDTILWGRRTYDWLVEYHRIRGKTTGLFDPRKRHYVFSRTTPSSAVDGVTFVNEPVRSFARRLRRRVGKHIWMMGGAGLIASFLDAGELDAFDLHVMPVMIGEGIPLVAPRHRLVPMRLRSARRYPDDVMRIRYEVER